MIAREKEPELVLGSIQQSQKANNLFSIRNTRKQKKAHRKTILNQK